MSAIIDTLEKACTSKYPLTYQQTFKADQSNPEEIGAHSWRKTIRKLKIILKIEVVEDGNQRTLFGWSGIEVLWEIYQFKKC